MFNTKQKKSAVTTETNLTGSSVWAFSERRDTQWGEVPNPELNTNPAKLKELLKHTANDVSAGQASDAGNHYNRLNVWGNQWRPEFHVGMDQNGTAWLSIDENTPTLTRNITAARDLIKGCKQPADHHLPDA